MKRIVFKFKRENSLLTTELQKPEAEETFLIFCLFWTPLLRIPRFRKKGFIQDYGVRQWYIRVEDAGEVDPYHRLYYSGET